MRDCHAERTGEANRTGGDKMADPKPDTRKIRIELPEGWIEAEGTETFLSQVRANVVAVVSPDVRPRVAEPGAPYDISGRQGETLTASPSRLPDIRALYEEKRPRTDTQSAALIGYFLSELAHPPERSTTV